MQVDEETLLTEIEFWRDMIASRRGMISEQAHERMVNARELAEKRLMLARTLAQAIETRQ